MPLFVNTRRLLENRPNGIKHSTLTSLISMSSKKAKVIFHFFDLHFTPYRGNEGSTSSQILKQCLQRINDEMTNEGKAIVIDRHEGRKDEIPRNIFIRSAAYSHKEKKYKCRIALIRDNKIPVLVSKLNYSFTPLDQLQDKALVETTNFYIDVEGDTPVVCCEFNNYGPRVSDIEYYLRYISSRRMLHISKACKASIHMKSPVKEVLDSITDVLRFNIKARPNNLKYLYQEMEESFIGNMKALANSVEPRSIRVNAFFREMGSKKEKYKNNKAVAFIKRTLKAFIDNSEIIDDFDDFSLEFEKKDGSEEVFNLIKGKHEIEIECSYRSAGNLNTKELYEKANIEFDEYIQSRKK